MWRVLVAVSIHFFVSEVHAQSNFANFDSMIFHDTRDLCSSVKNLGREGLSAQDFLVFKRAATTFAEGFGNGVRPWSKEAFTISNETRSLINSEGYKAAMYACYGNDKVSQNIFLSMIVADDVLGHVAGLGLWFYPIKKLIKAVGSSSWALANPRFVNTTSKILTFANRTALFSLIGYMGWNELALYQLKNNSKEEYNNFTKGILKSSRIDVENSYAILEQLLAEVNAEISKGTADKTRMEHLQREKQILEERLRARPK